METEQQIISVLVQTSMQYHNACY